jgi:cytochrome b6-f complex iron-sulfur subunit
LTFKEKSDKFTNITIDSFPTLIMKRRDFLSLLVRIFSATAIGSFAYPLIRFLAPPEEKTGAKSITLDKRSILTGKAKEVILGTTPAIVIDRPGKGYIALSRVCTHLGCLVNYDEEGKRLLCPCHAGIYDLKGRVLSGPPPRPLKQFPLRVEGNKIIVG